MSKPDTKLYEEVEKLFDLKVSSSGADITITMSGQSITIPYEDFLLLRQSIEELVVKYKSRELAAQFEELPMPHQMHIVGGLIHAFTAGMPEGAGFAEVNMENSQWQCLLVRKGAGYEKEVNALIAASEEE